MITDGGLKYLDSDPNLFSEFFHEIKISEADLYKNGEQIRAEDTSEDGYNKNIEPAHSVVRAVVADMKRRDQINIAHESLARHRNGERYELGMVYPSHGMVV